jgi:hypothetical protein
LFDHLNLVLVSIFVLKTHMPHRAYLVLAFLTLFSPLRAAETADFLLVRSLKGITLLDRFQQRLAPADIKALGSGVPFRVLKLDETLGDELTRAHRISYRDEIFFLVLNDAGALPGEKDNVEFLKNCAICADTILVKKEKAIFLQAAYQVKGPKQYVLKNERLYRQFKYKSNYYLQRGRISGWSSLQPVAAWEKVQSTVTAMAAPSVLTPLLDSRIRERIVAVNTAYRQYFAHFNRQASPPRTVPQWECLPGAAGLDCVWQGDQKTFRGLQASTKVLMQDFENILLGKQFFVTLKNTTISIRPEK